MNREVFIWTCFILTVACFTIAVFSVPRYYEFAMTITDIYIVSWLCFMGAAIYEVNRYAKLGVTGKVFWTLGLLFLSPVVGLIYLMSARKSLLK